MGKKINVLFLVDKSGFGGVQTIANKLIGTEIKCFNMYYLFLRDLDYKYGTKKIIKPNVFYSKSKYRYDIGSFFELKRLVKEKKFDIIHMNGNKSIIYGALIKKYFSNIITIAHEHGGKFDDKKTNFFILKRLRKYIDKFICLSNARKEKINSGAGIKEEKIIVLPNFVDLKTFNYQKNFNPVKLKKDFGLKEDSIIIGYVGGLHKIKGCDILIKAANLIKKKKMQVLVIGDGPEKENLKVLSSSLGLSKLVKFLGYRNNLAELYSLFDIIVVPSRWEAFGIVTLEAFAKKVPLICSTEVLKNGFLKDGLNCISFKSEDSKDLASKIDLLIANPLLMKRLSKEGFNICRSFLFGDYLKKLVKIYHEV